VSPVSAAGHVVAKLVGREAADAKFKSRPLSDFG
jgi:hypothetical protein